MFRQMEYVSAPKKGLVRSAFSLDRGALHVTIETMQAINSPTESHELLEATNVDFKCLDVAYEVLGISVSQPEN